MLTTNTLFCVCPVLFLIYFVSSLNIMVKKLPSRSCSDNSRTNKSCLLVNLLNLLGEGYTHTHARVYCIDDRLPCLCLNRELLSRNKM